MGSRYSLVRKSNLFEILRKKRYKRVKALEDISIKYDKTVRNSRGLIVQFLYGEDGLDATYMENVHIKFLGYAEKDLRSIYFNESVPEEYELIKKLQLHFIDMTNGLETNSSKLNDDYYPVPVNIPRIIKFAEALTEYADDEHLSDCEIYSEVCNLYSRISKNFEPSKLPLIGSEKDRATNATRLFQIYMHSELCTNFIKRLTKSQILYIMEEVEFKFKKAIAQPGEMCGILAAQSIGEPATQIDMSVKVLIQS